ncbi:MAG: EAL domain-containing protein [Myxococcota bacterium]|nr:EAL domain-containing protein [Myxococcota bacterium]
MSPKTTTSAALRLVCPPETGNGPDPRALEQELEWLRAVSVGTGDAQIALDREGRCRFIFLPAGSSLDWDAAEVQGRPLDRWIHREDRRHFAAQLSRSLTEPGHRVRMECRLRLDCGLWSYVEISLVNLLERPKVGVIAVHLIDISERRRIGRELAERSDRLNRVMDASNDGLWDWDLEADEMFFSRRWSEMLGLEPRSVGTEPAVWLDRIHPQDREQFESVLTAHLRGETENFETDQRVQHADGSYRWVLCRGQVARDSAGRALRIVGAQIDISRRKLRDPLTGLLNREAMRELVQERLDRRADDGEPSFAVLLIDLDRFKVINDSLGHPIGDQVLCSVARRLEEQVQPGDSVSRLGGDEFCILLDRVGDAEEAARRAAALQDALARAHSVGSTEAYSTASVGLVLSDRGYSKAGEMIRDADTALNRAKADGRDQTKTFRTTMREQSLANFQLEVDLRRALQREEFSVRYQPIVDLDGCRLVGFESLVRWNHPSNGLLSPAEFIPLAEELGLIVGIDRWVLGEAAHRLSEWQQGFHGPDDLVVSVNISSRQFRTPDLVDVVSRTLERWALDPRCLKLEVTETAVVDNPRRASETLQDLKKLGVRLALDDFGTGYSSLSHLHRFPFDIIKIDRSFISRMGIDGHHPEIVRTIISLADSLRMDVVAEGVETALQGDILRDMGCRYAQGYFFAKPLHEHDALRLVEGVSLP